MTGIAQVGALRRLPIRIGRDQFGTPLIWDPVTGGHTLMAGATRSGKSVGAMNTLGGLAGHPAVRVCGFDPSRVLLHPFMQRFADPWIVLGTGDPQRIAAVMDEWLGEMDRRLDALVARGVDKLDEFTAREPLHFIVLEEWPGLVRALDSYDKASGAKVADRLLSRVQLGFLRLASEGHKVGVRLLLICQRADAAIIDGYAREQLTQRISFRQNGVEGLRMMFPNLEPAELARAQHLEPGCGYLSTPATRGHQLFKCDSVVSYQRYVDRVKSFTPQVLQRIAADQGCL